MYKTPADKYYLQLFLRQPGDENPKPEEIKECGTKCSLRRFYKIYDELIPDEFEVECGVKKPNKPKSEKSEKLDHIDEPNLRGTSKGFAVNGNSRMFSIVLCSLWFVRKFI